MRRASAGSSPSSLPTTGISRRLSSQRPDMVALDLGMPGMDGVELLRFLAEQDYRSPVLIVSGFDRRVLESRFPAWRSAWASTWPVRSKSPSASKIWRRS